MTTILATAILIYSRQKYHIASRFVTVVCVFQTSVEADVVVEDVDEDKLITITIEIRVDLKGNTRSVVEINTMLTRVS